MATANTKYGSVTSFAITNVSQADQSIYLSAVITNAVTLALDYQISGLLTVGAAVATGDMYIVLYSYDGNNYSYPATGSNLAITTLPRAAYTGLDAMRYGDVLPGTELVFGCKVPMRGLPLATAVGIQSFNISQAFNAGGLNPPLQFGIGTINMQGQALDATQSHNILYYAAITQTIA
jgi:hypothetical protein